MSHYGRDSAGYRTALHYTKNVAKRPAGRAPNGKAWCAQRQTWVDKDQVIEEHVTKKMCIAMMRQNKFTIFTAPKPFANALRFQEDSEQRVIQNNLCTSPSKPPPPQPPLSKFERMMNKPFQRHRSKKELVMVHGDGTNGLEEGESELQEVTTEWTEPSPVCYLP